MKIRWAFKIMEVLNQYFMFVLYYLFFCQMEKPSRAASWLCFKATTGECRRTRRSGLNRWTLLCHLAFLSTLATFLIFFIMSTIASHAQFTPSDMLLRSNWYSWCFFHVSIWKDSLKVFMQLHLCVPWYWESLPDTAQCPPWPSSTLSLEVRVNAWHFQWINLRLTPLQNVFTQIRVQVCMCYNCFIHSLFF